MISAPEAQGHIPCPFCQSPVPFAVTNLLNASSNTCPSCSAQFQLDVPASSQALDQLRFWYQQMNQQVDDLNQKTAATAQPSSESGLEDYPYQKRRRRSRRG